MVSKNRTGEEGVSPEDQLARLDAALRASGVNVEALRSHNAGASYVSGGGYEPELRNLAAQGGGNNPEAAAARAAGIEMLKRLVAIRVRDPQQAGELLQFESDLSAALVSNDIGAIMEKTNAVREAIATAEARRLSDRMHDAQDLERREAQLKQLWADVEESNKKIKSLFEQLAPYMSEEEKRRLHNAEERYRNAPEGSKEKIEALKDLSHEQRHVAEEVEKRNPANVEVSKTVAEIQTEADKRDIQIKGIERIEEAKELLEYAPPQEIKSTAFSREQNNGDERESATQPIRSSMAERRRVNQPPKDGGNLEERNNKELASSSVDGSFASVNLTVDEVDSPHEAKEPNVRDIRDKSSPAGPVRQS